MFLKSLELNGFKSFPDRTHIDFTDGITSLLGPNGCGKSNIVDAIKWVLGEQSTKTLRASSMQDVIFNGTDTRKPLPMAEVTLAIDNENHNLQTDVPEIAIRRRIYRTGESEYYLNGQRCLLKNIKELFMDTGVGKSAYSILEQGKIDQILSNKPEDRRYIFEEAAGISRYKAKCVEAQNRIAKADEHIAQLMITVQETKRTYDRTRSQAQKAMQWEELSARAFELDVDMNLAHLLTLLKLKDMREERKANAEVRKEELKQKLESFDDNINLSSDEVNAVRDEVRALELKVNSNEVSIQGITDIIATLEDNYRSYIENMNSSQSRCEAMNNEIERLKSEKMEAEEQLYQYQDSLEEKENQLKYTQNELERTHNEIRRYQDEIAAKEVENEKLDEELVNLSEELKSVIESLLAEVDAKTGSEYSFERREKADKRLVDAIKAMSVNIKNQIAFISNLDKGVDLSQEIALREYKNLSDQIEKLFVLFDEYKASIPPVIDTLLSPEGLMVKKRSVEAREEDARREIDQNRKTIASSRESVGMLQLDVQTFQTTIASIKEHLGALRSYVQAEKDKLKSYDRMILQRELDLEDERKKAETARARVEEIGDRIKDKDNEKANLMDEIKSLKAQMEAANGRLNEKFSALANIRREKDETFRALNEAQHEFEAQSMYIENTEQSIKDVYVNFFDKHARNLGEFEERMRENIPEEQVLRQEYEEVQKKIQSLGSINHLAKDEFDQAEDQYKFYTRQLDDYNKAKQDMENVLKEIESKSIELFLESYKTISNNFQQMFKRLFGGGNAELKLQDEENVLTSGIDILAQPPGKSKATLSLLSGGERSMTAVALLFATYQVKPSPFCILDEIDAALDDRNIGFFLDVLQDFSRDSQFIIITHNKHTVTGGNAMLGVSQQEAGVSTAVAYRIASVKGQPVIMNDENEAVEFDEEGRRK